MPCYHPLVAWRGKPQASGKRAIVFKAQDAGPGLSAFPLKLPCGQCIGCRLERSRQWAMRCVHEAQLYERNCFVTLTYDEAHLPEGGSLSVKTFQKFMKRLRKKLGSGVRYFHCGEYGETFGRPHYHACLFNCDFADKVLWSIRNGNRLYVSPTLTRVWGLGHAVIGDVTFESAAYVARYVMKKITGEAASEHYVNRRTGEVLKPEYVTMSRRPGLGARWYEKFKFDIYPGDYAIMRGVKVRPPKFYDGQFELEDPEGFKKLKSDRVSRASKLVPAWSDLLQKIQMIDDNRDDRLAVKEELTKSRISLLRRSLEV